MRTKVLAAAVILFVLGMAAFSWWSSQSRTVFAQVETTLADELTQALGTKVTIGQLQAAGLTAATAADVKIFDKQNRQLADIKQVTVEYSLFSILRGQTAVDAIKKVILTNPKIILVEETDGTWNFDCFRQNAKPGSPSFTGKVALAQGDIRVYSPKGEWEFGQAEGEFEVQGSQSIAMNVSALHNGSPLSVQGFINNTKNELSLTVKASQLNPAVYGSLLPAGTQLTFRSGSLKDVEVMAVGNPGKLKFAGEFSLDDIAVETDGVQVEQARGRVTFTNNNIYIFEGSALAASQPIAVRGKIGIEGDQPVFDLALTSTGFDPAVLNYQLPFSGKVAFDAKFAGTLQDPLVTAKLTAAQATLQDYPLKNAAASVKYTNKVVQIEAFSAGMLGGQITGRGAVDIDTQRYQVELAAKNIATGAIKGLPVELTGQGEINASVNGQGSDWQSAAGVATFTLNSGVIQGVPYKQIAGLVESSNNRTQIEYFNVMLPSGLVAVNGVIQNDNLALKLNGQSIELNDITSTYSKGIGINGTASIAGEITGTTAQPLLNLGFTIEGLKVKEQLFGKAAGKVKATPSQLDFEQVTITDGTARHELTGTVLLTQAEPELNLRLSTYAARAETFARILAPELKLTGNLNHELILTGRMSNPDVRGTINLTDGSLYGYLIASAAGTYERKDGAIVVKNMNMVSLNTKIKLAGTVAPDNNLNFDVTAEEIDISRLRLNYPYPVSGKVNLAGQVTGSISNPVVAGRLETPGIMLNGQEIRNIFARLSYVDSQADISELSFTQGTGHYAFSGSADLKTKGVDGILRVEGGELTGILAIANVPDRGICGKLNGEIVLNGTADNPNVIVRGAINSGSIKSYPLDNIDIDAELNNKIITINKFIGKQGPSGMLAARGQANLNGAIDMEFGGRDIDTGIIAALFDTTIDTKGSFSFNAQASGATADPNVAMSLEIKNGSVANAEFDNLYGLFIYNQGSIHVNQLYIARGPYKASAYGVVPLKALNRQGRSQADISDRMDLKVRLDHADLSILPMLTQEVAWGSGPTAGEVTIGGTLAQPTLNGHVSVAKGTIKLKALSEPIQNVGVDIQFEDDKININTFSGEMGGGSYAIAGSARLNGLALDEYNMALTLKHLGVKHKYFAGPLDGVLSLTSVNGRPHLSGKLTVDNATVNIPAVPDSGDFSLDAGLDVELVIGNKVRMYNPYLYDFRAEGKVKFSGTLQKPAASGRIEARRGTVKYLTNLFTIETASAEFTQYNSIEPVIKLKAKTRLDQMTVYLDIHGPVTAMNMKLTSQPAMSQEEIMSILTLRSSYFSDNDHQSHNESVLGRDQLISLLDAGLQMRFIAEIENTMQKALGVDRFRLVKSSIFDTDRKKTASEDQPSGQLQSYNLEVSKYLTDKLMLSYSMGLDQKNSSVSLQYELNNRISIGGTFGGTNRELYTIETRFNF